MLCFYCFCVIFIIVITFAFCDTYIRHKERTQMAHTAVSLPTKRKILSVCVKLFLEQGYKKSTVAEIVNLADVSISSFQNLFRAKDGVLTELLHFMYGNQFRHANLIVGTELSPIFIYAVETAIQLTLTELNENLREIYVEAYSHEEALGYIHRMTAENLAKIFAAYNPDFTDADFFNCEIGTGGLMRAYMLHPCNDTSFTLNTKLERFLTAALRIYRVPENEIAEVIAFITGLDMRKVAQGVMKDLFEKLAMHYNFSLDGLLVPEEA